MRLFSLCTFVRFETMIWPSIRFDISLQNFKKPLDIFSPQIERKRSKEYLVIILAVKESLERFSCLEFIFEKANTGKPAYKMKNINKDFPRHFNICLREWKLLSLYMFHRIIFLLLLIVSSLFAILIAVPFVFSRSWTSLAGVVKMPRVSNAFEDYTSL